ncbi:MAG: hypothetical protein LAT64_14290 [Phycisphaerales bacterium]|nr:phage holin family protein [Planctomycetota bacterium]MCH8509921.1 hypothetical protein [Phycisphaerales bacterium]
MIWRIRKLIDGAGDLLRAEVDLAAIRFRQGVLAGILLAAAISVALIGLGGILAGLTVAVAEAIGWIGALLAVGLLLLVLGGLSAWPIIYQLNAATMPGSNPRKRAALSKRQMSDAVDPSMSKKEARQRARAGAAAVQGSTPSESNPPPPPPPPEDRSDEDRSESFAHTAAGFVAKHPMAVAGGTFLVLSIVGPFRVVRMVSKGIALASLTSTVIDAMKDDEKTDASASTNGHAASASRPGPRDKPATPPPPGPGRRTTSTPGPRPAARKPPASAVEPKVQPSTPRFQID